MRDYVVNIALNCMTAWVLLMYVQKENFNEWMIDECDKKCVPKNSS